MPTDWVCGLLKKTPGSHVHECGWPGGHTNSHHKCMKCGDWFKATDPLSKNKSVVSGVVKEAFYD